MDQRINNLDPAKVQQTFKRYTLCFILSFMVIFGLFFFFLNTLLVKDIEKQLQAEGEIFIEGFALWEDWIKQYNGVYVHSDKVSPTNPIRKYMPFDATVMPRLRPNPQYVFMPPCFILQEIAASLAQKTSIRFNLINLSPLAIGNTTDTFGFEALQQIKQGGKEIFGLTEEEDGTLYYRMIIPIFSKETDFVCHTGQAYKEGDLLGALSLSVPATELIEQTKKTRELMLWFGVPMTLCFALALHFLGKYLINALVRAQILLRSLTSTDLLTGLLLRDKGLQTLSFEMARAKLHDTPLCVALIGINSLRIVNEAYGHTSGDALLKALSGNLQQAFQKYGTLCRYTGEEFLLIMPHVSLDDSRAMLQRTLASMTATPYAISKISMPLTMSAGVSLYQPNENLDVLTDRVATLLRQARDVGHGRVCHETR